MAEHMKKIIRENRQTGPGALQLVEEAFHVLRTVPFAFLIPYYLGTMPFLLALLYFWNDMSRSAFAGERCLTASLALALLYAWMKTWQSVFSIRIYDHISRDRSRSWPLSSVTRLAAAQTILHASSFVVLPVALLITLPFAWTFAMYQMVLVHDFTPGTSLTKLLKDYFNAAQKYTLMNHLLLPVIFLFGFFVFLNIGITLYMLPFLAKSLFGVESAFTMGGFNVMNTTFLLAVTCLTHLCVDPLVKTVFTIEKFYCRSRKTGDDLMAGLNTIKQGRRQAPRTTGKTSKTMVVALLCLSLFSLPAPGHAETGSPSPAGQAAIDAPALESAIDHVMSRREFAWRMPGEEIRKEGKQDRGFLYTAVNWVLTVVKETLNTIGSWIEDFFERLIKIFRRDDEPAEEEEPEAAVKPRHLTIGLTVMIAVLLAFVILLRLRMAAREEPVPASPGNTLPDIEDEHLLADRLPSDQWVEYARELMEKGDLRAAIRALYLGTLAFLADQNLIAVAGHKSNREYREEFSRRAHSKKDMVGLFDDTVRTVDRVWYGMHRVNRQMFDDFSDTQKRIMDIAG